MAKNKSKVCFLFLRAGRWESIICTYYMLKAKILFTKITLGIVFYYDLYY
jgi:hypothetical protein